ncbi:MAG TPA: hypothetical protein VJ817_16065 [Gemmatimonadales bacterium]|nr:hypothetical protein [Gemmatimonadales bacterium]
MGTKTPVAALLILLGPAASAQSQAPAELLQSALYQHEVRGDLPAALRLYQRILAGPGGDRSTAARALVQMALVYETMGSDSAVGVYRRVLAEYSDQQDPAERARQRLAVLVRSPGGGKSGSGIIARQLWSTRTGLGANPLSPDGGRVAFVDWGTIKLEGLRGNADLALFDLTSRRASLVTNRPSQSKTDVYISDAVWSPDGQRLAYALWDTTWTHQDLWLVGADGRGNTLLVNNEQFANLDPMEWSGPGGFIAARVKGWDERYRIVLISSRDGASRIVKTLDAHAPHAISVSSDGRYLLYDYHQGEGSEDHDLFLLAADGSSEVRLAAHPADEPGGFFTPDGSRVVFLSGRSGQQGLWAVRVAGGKAAGEPELIRPDLGSARLIGFTRAGALSYATPRNESDISLGVLDFGPAPSLSSLRPLTGSFVGRNWRAAWSPDGSRVAYLSNRGAEARTPHLVVASATGGEERSHRLPFRVLTRATRPSWTADGTAVLLEGGAAGDPAPSDFRRVTWRVDLATGTAVAEAVVHHAAGVAGGIFRYATPRQTQRLAELKLRLFGQSDLRRHSEGDLPVAPGEDALLVREGVHRSPGGDFQAGRWLVRGHMHTWELSPDGNTLALALPADTTRAISNVLYLMPVTGGPMKEIARVAADQEIGVVRWHPDGRNLLFGAFRAEHERGDLWHASSEGGSARRIDLGLDWRQLAELDFDGNGQRVAITTMSILRELWIMEGFPWQRRATP